MALYRMRKDSRVSVKRPRCVECNVITDTIYRTETGTLLYLCGSCEYLRLHPDAPRAKKLPRERRPKGLQKEQLFPVDGE